MSIVNGLAEKRGVESVWLPAPNGSTLRLKKSNQIFLVRGDAQRTPEMAVPIQSGILRSFGIS